MWERFTENAKHVVSAAQEEATRLGSNYVHREHLLLGICRAKGGVAARALENLGVDVDALAREVEQQVKPGPPIPTNVKIAFMARARNVLALAADEARRFKHDYIGTEHILLGLLKENEDIAAKVLQDRTVDIDRAQAEVVRLLEEQASQD